MEKSDWSKIVQNAPRINLRGTIWRVVECQEEIATTAIVDTIEEQTLLEQLLEESKPDWPESAKGLHYLLATPFRYPPLKWGSRFGEKFQKSLYYGSFEISTALAESAYYRFIFWYGMEIPPPEGKLITQHTIFSVTLNGNPWIELQNPPFIEFLDILTNIGSYVPTQNLGTILRESAIQGFSYISARCPEGGINAALFTPEALESLKPVEEQSWICETRPEAITFKGPTDIVKFKAEWFGGGNFSHPEQQPCLNRFRCDL